MKWTSLLAVLNQRHLNDLYFLKSIMVTIDDCITGFKHVKEVQSNLNYLSLRYYVIVLEVTQGLETKDFALLLTEIKKKSSKLA